VGQAATKLEADSLREELAGLKEELRKFNKTRLAARGEPAQVRRRVQPKGTMLDLPPTSPHPDSPSLAGLPSS